MKNHNLIIPYELSKRAKRHGKKIVLVTGVFDLLHQEHINFLKKASKVGDLLFVGVECDKRVKQMKGADRPKDNELLRIKKIRHLGIADCVFLLPEDFDNPEVRKNFILKLRPDILAVSSHTKFIKQKQQIMSLVGGEVKIVHQHNPLISTTKIIKQGVKG